MYKYRFCILLFTVVLICIYSYMSYSCTEPFEHLNITYKPNSIITDDISDNKKKILVYHSVSYAGKNPPYMDLSTKINKSYCDKWGYDFKIINHKVAKIPYYWLRVQDLLNLLETTDYEYICYMDVDAVFYNHDLSVENIVDHIEKETNITYDMFIGNDITDGKILNSGVFFIKNTQWSKDFIKRWLRNCVNEEGTLVNVCKPWKLINNKWDCIGCKWAGTAYEQGNLEKMFIDNTMDSKQHIAVLNKLYLSNDISYMRSYILHLMAKSDKYRLNKFQKICYAKNIL